MHELLLRDFAIIKLSYKHFIDISVKYWFLIINTALWLFYSGPEGTCFEGGIFPAKLVFPPDYPLSPPKMQFICEMFHPNSEYYYPLLIYSQSRIALCYCLLFYLQRVEKNGTAGEMTK